MADSSRDNCVYKCKIDTIPPLPNIQTAVRKPFSASSSKAVYSKTESIKRPSSSSLVSLSSSPNRAKALPVTHVNGLQDEVSRALEKYYRSAMYIPQTESVSESIEAQLIVLQERIQVSQLLLESTRKQMENISFKEEDDTVSCSDLLDAAMPKTLDFSATKLSSGIGIKKVSLPPLSDDQCSSGKLHWLISHHSRQAGLHELEEVGKAYQTAMLVLSLKQLRQCQQTLNNAVSMLDKVKVMNSFHKSTGLEQNDSFGN